MGRTIQFNDGVTTHTNLDFYGKDLVIENPGELMTDRYGLSTCTTVWRAPADFPFGSLPGIGAVHPLYGGLAMERRRVQKQEGYYTVTGEFAGLLAPATRSDSVFELSIGVQDEPIVSHPNFKSAIGGTPSNPLHGAVFLGPDGLPSTDDGTANFAYFSNTSDFAGIESYLAADFMTWRERFVCNFLVYGSIGRIQAPSGPAPPATNWLLICVSFEQRATALFVTNEWRAGGRRGWNSAIYG